MFSLGTNYNTKWKWGDGIERTYLLKFDNTDSLKSSKTTVLRIWEWWMIIF